MTAAGWGLFGGLCALINPMVALVWVCFSLMLGIRQRAWTALAVAMLTATLVSVPWAVRNYRVFGRLIPVKSNLAYELYQSQCLQSGGLLELTTFWKHPYWSTKGERTEHKEMGEMAFLDHKSDLFWRSVGNDPLDFGRRVSERFIGTTLWYVPLDRHEPTSPWTLFLVLSFLVLVLTARRDGLTRTQLIVVCTYAIYLLPYIAVSYYYRYSLPLIGIKAMLMAWAVERLLHWNGVGVGDLFVQRPKDALNMHQTLEKK